jgi:low affinity Fe/Cu permease
VILSGYLPALSFHYSDTWQLVINTGTTIVTFIMVFIIQHSQNKDTTAIQLKLNELIATNNKASNRLVNIEDLSEEELDTLKAFISPSPNYPKTKKIFSVPIPLMKPKKTTAINTGNRKKKQRKNKLHGNGQTQSP